MTPTRRGWVHLASGAAAGRVLGFASNLLLSRWLGPSELGMFNLVSTTVQTSDTLSRCGGDYALNYELGGQSQAMRTPHGAELARGFAQLCSLTTVVICVAVAIWVWFGHGLFPSSLLPTQRITATLLLLLMIACEGSSASAWEVLLVSQRTDLLALRQGLFFPIRLFSASLCALYGGFLGAMCGWIFIAFIQFAWLKTVLKDLWRPLQVLPLLVGKIRQLLKRGLPFYAANLLASIIFYPLLLNVAAGSGLSQIGYLRVGQILQQFFAFLPATLVPVLFLKLRSESTFADQVALLERPLRVIWLLLIEVLFLYCIVDKLLIVWLFGTGFASALLSTRLLLITALFECLSQLVLQPFLASGRTRLYVTCQNISAILAAVLGWFWIPDAGLAAYLIVRLLYVTIPLIAFGIPVLKKLHDPQKVLVLVFASLITVVLFLVMIFTGYQSIWMPLFFAVAFLVILASQRNDLLFLSQLLRKP